MVRRYVDGRHVGHCDWAARTSYCSKGMKGLGSPISPAFLDRGGKTTSKRYRFKDTVIFHQQKNRF